MDFNVVDSVRRDFKVLMTKTRYTVVSTRNHLGIMSIEIKDYKFRRFKTHLYSHVLFFQTWAHTCLLESVILLQIVNEPLLKMYSKFVLQNWTLFSDIHIY